MGTIFALTATFSVLLLLVARPFIKGVYSAKFSTESSRYVAERSAYQSMPSKTKNWKFDPHEEKLLHQLLANPAGGISVKELNSILNLEGKSAENQRQRRHLVIKELNTKLFVLFNVRECIVRIPESFDSRKKQYVILIHDEVIKELNNLVQA